MSRLFCLCLLATFLTVSQGFIQELYLHESEDENGNFHVFRNNVDNLSSIDFYAIKRVCASGMWTAFREEGYGGYTSKNFGIIADKMSCENVEDFNYKSIRHAGQSDTTKKAMCFYPTADFGGEEFCMEQSAYGGITTIYRSAAQTGTSNWTLFEGANFNGTSACFSNRYDADLDSRSDIQEWFDITMVGSLFQGCPGNLAEFNQKVEQARILVGRS